MASFQLQITLSVLVGLAVALRLGMLLFGEWQDAHMQVKYTDIDYSVFNDAAKYVLQSESPYKRATYRYTPLLAYMMLPNLTYFRAFGKLVFVACDLVAGVLMHRILVVRGFAPSTATKCAAVWLLNPFVATISTRGSAESILAVLVLATFYAVLTKRLITSSLLFGLAVHFKIYPVIYAVPLFFMMNSDFTGSKSWEDIVEQEKKKGRSSSGLTLALRRVVHFLNGWRLAFSLLSAGTFFLLGFIMYRLYGYEFLYETYLYHVTRKDHRHNFSVYFYFMYLIYSSPASLWTSLVSFLPSVVTTFATGFMFRRNFIVAAFLQTWVFVMFNKVCTSQYFL